MKTLLLIASAMLLCASGQGQSSLTNMLVAYYPFNGDAHDASGNGNNGTVEGATLTHDRFGAPNSAYSFDGVQSRIRIPETLFSSTNTGVTVSFWVTTDNGPYDSLMAIFSKSGLNGTMGLSFSGGQVQFGPKLQDNYWYFATAPVRSNSVTHLVGVYQKGQSNSLYVDGVLANSIAVPDETLFVDTAYPLVSAIGIYDFTPAPSAAFRGVIDDVRVYTRALSASEVAQLHAAEAQCIPHAAAATATIVSSSVSTITVTDPGCGYTNAPLVLVVGGGGAGAAASCTISNGMVVSITVTNGGAGYTNAPTVIIASPPFTPSVSIAFSKVKVSLHLLLGHNYILESSPDLTAWTQVGPPFTAQTELITQEFDVQATGRFFRVREVP